ncbi:RNA dependent RNA polymerase-domain-containing protein [Phaeosphaeriaceae sp. PMI808]|nr:RNA dependent RNA polymerase-domain-containing protein [Phaeosphaeriaceae sp. PMI808]
MKTLRSYNKVLQANVSPEDEKWDYFISDLPKPQQTNPEGLVKCVSVISSRDKQHITLRLGPVPSNRVTHNESLDRFILLSFSDFKLQWPAISASGPPRPATGKENGNWMTRMLLTGIKINGVTYHFFGHSNSQLKSRSCFLYAASKEEISAKVEAMGDLSKLKSVGKKAKRIGLLFSSAEVTLDLPPNRCQDIEDVATKDYIYTDGCGLISSQLARHLAQKRNIVFRDRRYCPSVFQIRYRGYKGVLTLDPTLQGQIQIQFRASMRKFKDSPDHSFAVVDYSKPYSFGSLNDEVVVLLYTLGISQEMLLAKQAEHLKFLQNVSQGDPRAAFQFLSYISRIDLAEKLLLEGLDSVLASLKALVKQEYVRMINKRNEQRCRILIPKSRLLFGICDPTAKDGFSGRLREGECFVRITQDGDGRAQTIINTEVLVTRNPCLHPGDLQKFKAIDIPEFSHLTDCIVFSTKGQRPSADLMSGGDLDGDKFFVTWDKDIIPRTMAEPAQYPGGKEPINFGEITGDSRAEYFARYTNASLGKVKNLYMKWARLGGSMSSECQQLNRLFSQCVDGNHIKVPANLEDPREPSPSAAPFILDVLHQNCLELIESTANLNPEAHDDPDIMELLLTRDKVAMSEFELLQVVIRWCDRNGIDLMEYSQFINFSALTDEQQIWFLGILPPSVTTSSLVRNGLLQSGLIYPEEFRRFGLDHPRLRWKPVFKSTNDRMGRFLPTVCRSLEVFHKKLILLNLSERLSMAVYIPQKIARASEVSVDSNVRVFVFPHSQGQESANYCVVPTKVNYRLYCDENVFQLYQLKKQDTWIFLNASKGDNSSYRALSSQGDKRRAREYTMSSGINFDCRASIALNKISRDVQTHAGKVQREGVLGAEIYVISNRDVASMNVLDQWLHYIDTEELELDYEAPKLTTLTWEDYPEHIQSVCRDSNLPSLQRILDLLKQHGEKSRLRDIFSYILSTDQNSVFALNDRNLVSTLMNFLPDAVYLTSWTIQKEFIGENLIPLAPIIDNELTGLVRRPLFLLLRELKRMSLQDFAELIELVALAVRTSEAALDLLLEVLEPETSRLLVGRPIAIRQFTTSLFGIALDHIDEADSGQKSERESIKLVIENEEDGFTVVKSFLRVDSSISSILKVGDHIRLSVTNAPRNDPLAKRFSMDALVTRADTGACTLRCLNKPPVYIEQCAWSITQCGSFVTSKTTFDALMAFYTEREACCPIFASLLGLSEIDQIELPNVNLQATKDPSLNESQNDALLAAMQHSLTLIWGPPGTGKTHTIIVILSQLLKALPKSRFLITAPTHNAYTCDAMMGKDLNSNLSARQARLVFTTCIGASLVIPATLVPLVKGCTRAILVGDHVQLRATVQKSAVVVGYDVSLFERHYNMPRRDHYRMHRTICDFSSTEFYESKLKTAVADHSRPLPESLFPWPKEHRVVWMECRQSKSNQGQVELCKQVVRLLTSPATSTPAKSPACQGSEALSAAIPSIEGREADIIVFVTVRCNASLNVVMTRAKCGVVIIGGVGENVWKRLVEGCQVVEIESDAIESVRGT